MEAWNGSPVSSIEGVAGIIAHREIRIGCPDGVFGGAEDSERLSVLPFWESGVSGIAIASVGGACFGWLQLGQPIDSGESFDRFSIYAKERGADRDGFVREAYQPFDIVLGRGEALDWLCGEVERNAEEWDFLDKAGICRGGSEVHGNRGCGKDGDFIAARGAEIPEEAIDEDLIAGVDISGPKSLTLPDFTDGSARIDGRIRIVCHVIGEQLLQIDFASFQDIGGNFVRFSRNGEESEARGALGVGMDGDGAVIGSDDIEVSSSVYEPLEGSERFVGVEEGRCSGESLRVDSIEGRLHGAGRDFERLEEVCAESESDAERDNEGFDDFEEEGIGARGEVRQDGIEGGAADLGGVLDLFRAHGRRRPAEDQVPAGVQQSGVPRA